MTFLKDFFILFFLFVMFRGKSHMKDLKRHTEISNYHIDKKRLYRNLKALYETSSHMNSHMKQNPI